MATDVRHRIRRLFSLFILAFLALIGWQSYWHLSRSDWLLAQPTNRRLARAELDTPRGTIYGREGKRLAWTEDGERHYADPRATAAVLGYLDPVYGRTGVEGEWNLELSGLSRTFTADDLQRILRREKPHGKDVLLTLDLGLQRAALNALRGRRGAVALLDPASGGILALASYPTFDPRTIRQDFTRLTDDDNGALRNRAVQDLYPPGSSMKVVTAAAALKDGVDPATTYRCQGKTKYENIAITDYHGTAHGVIAMENALAKSCNYYFARTALALPRQSLFDTAEAFGFGRPWWDHLPDQRMLPLNVVESSLSSRAPDEIPPGEIAQMGFGQATVVATPLQMAMVCAAIANEGMLQAPYLVSEVRKGGTEQALERFKTVPVGFPLNSRDADRLAGMMRRVVTSGTGRGADIPGITVYGKTGTAQQRGGEDHAWFIGFAEHERDGRKERIAFAVVIERGGTGGRVAVPVAKEILTYWAKR